MDKLCDLSLSSKCVKIVINKLYGAIVYRLGHPAHSFSADRQKKRGRAMCGTGMLPCPAPNFHWMALSSSPV